MPNLLDEGQAYANRRDALFQRTEMFASFTHTQARTVDNPTRAYALRQLSIAAQQLRKFAESHLQYFNNETDNRPPEGYTAEYAIALAIHQIGFDLEVLEQAAYQRLNSTPEGKTMLDIADQMARLITSEATKLRDVSNSEVSAIPLESSALVYFQKSPRFHGMPYATMALTAIPYTATNTRRDLLAMPHEIGHYVFWRMNKQELFEKAIKIESKNGWTGRWLEEIFADIFCYLVAGPIAGLSLQDLLLRHAHSTFATVDSGDSHPAPILRPYIHQLVLQLRNQAAIAQDVMTRWQTRLANKLTGQPNQVILPFTFSHLVSSLVTTNGPTAGKPIDQIVNQIYSMLELLQPVSKWAGQVGETPLSNEAEVERQLDTEFPQRVTPITEASLTDIQLETDPWHNWLQREGFIKGNPNHWLDIAHARGWVERPPDNWPKGG